jgi:tripartite-type tricarboxylate transporter receptor subunit TctC
MKRWNPCPTRRHALVFAAALAAGAALPAAAQTAFPTQPVRIVVGSEAGSAPDVIARSLAKELEPLLKQPVVVDNRAGAAGTVGAAAVAQAAPDGHTLLMGTVSNVALAPVFYPIRYKPVESFTAVGMVASVPLVLVASAGTGATTVAELGAKLRAGAGAPPAPYASPGIGGPQHLAGVLLEKQFATPLLHVPYKSGGAAMTAVAGGEVQLAFAGIPAALPLLQSRRVNALFVTAATRSPALPDVPSAPQAGLPGFEVDNWHALLAPAGLKPEVRAVLEAALRAALQKETVRKDFERLGAEPRPGTGAELADFVARETARWGALARDAGLGRTP